MNVKKICYMSLLTGIALIIFTVELRIPNLVPIPGVKLGLANIITVYGLYHLRARETAMILLVRIFLGSVFGGNLSAMIYSLSGGLLCLAGMILMRKILDERYIWLCSIIGGILHNIGQTAAALAVMRTTAVIAYLPLLLISGCIAGAFTGLCAQFATARLGKYIDL
ncbi:MAG: Gx transporter family protein [Alistipes sp.]|nr:Gx transporter family protein [Alistipes sp.]